MAVKAKTSSPSAKPWQIGVIKWHWRKYHCSFLTRLIHKFFNVYERVNNSLSSEPGFMDWTDYRDLCTVYIIPVEKPLVQKGFSEKELQYVWTGRSPVSSAIPEKSEVNEDKGFSRGVLSLFPFFTRVKKGKEYFKNSCLTQTYRINSNILWIIRISYGFFYDEFQYCFETIARLFRFVSPLVFPEVWSKRHSLCTWQVIKRLL